MATQLAKNMHIQTCILGSINSWFICRLFKDGT